jgi:hypothetical protein
MGPSRSDNRNQFSPLRPRVCASPALMRASVPQPAVYSLFIAMPAFVCLTQWSLAAARHDNSGQRAKRAGRGPKRERCQLQLLVRRRGALLRDLC